MGFQQGLSGLRASSTSLDVIGNNVANASTVGFKAARAEFADVFASAISGAASDVQVGIGVQVTRVRTLFTQGNITTTSNPFDIAIQGEGFFRMDNNGTIKYSRNGQFTVDKDGFIINNNGDKLTGYGVNENGQIITARPGPMSLVVDVVPPRPTSSAIQTMNLDSRAPAISRTDVPASTDGTGTIKLYNSSGNPANFTYSTDTAGNVTWNSADATSGSWFFSSTGAGAGPTAGMTTGTLDAATTAAGNTSNVFVPNSPALSGVAFDMNNTKTFTWSTSITLFDSLGNSHVMTTYYTKVGPGRWELHAAVDGDPNAIYTDQGAGLSNTQPISMLQFDTNGELVNQVDAKINITIPGLGSAVSGTDYLQSGAGDLNFLYDLTGATQYGQVMSNDIQRQDGFTSGRLTGFSISAEGVISANYSNAQTRPQGQIVLATFTNPNGLIPVGGNNFVETFASGQERIGEPGSSNFGTVRSQALEDSTVDLTQELVNMITAQRVYQANSQTIKTQDSILQTIVNLR